jgi:hypothetical protein
VLSTEKTQEENTKEDAPLPLLAAPRCRIGQPKVPKGELLVFLFLLYFFKERQQPFLFLLYFA